MTLYNKSILSLLSTVVSLSTAMAMEQQPEATDHLSALPDELKVEILSYLPVSEIAPVSMVNTSWNTIAKDDALWKNYCAQANLEMSAKAENQTWEEFYKDELRPVPVRFSIQKPNQTLNDISHYKINFMGHNFSLTEDPQKDRLRKNDLIILTKDMVRKNYGCAYSVATQLMFAQNSPYADKIVYWNGLENITPPLPEKSLLLDSLHKMEAFAIFLGKDCKVGELNHRYKVQAPAKS